MRSLIEFKEKQENKHGKLKNPILIEGLPGIANVGKIAVDFMIDERTGSPSILEINTIPGLTEMSLLPMAARYKGITFEELVERIVHSARLKVQ